MKSSYFEKAEEAGKFVDQWRRKRGDKQMNFPKLGEVVNIKMFRFFHSCVRLTNCATLSVTCLKIFICE